MIITEFFTTREDGVNLYRTYSDAGLYIKQEQTDAEYAEAIDVEDSGYTYTETDQPIDEIDAGDDTEQMAEAARILLGMKK